MASVTIGVVGEESEADRDSVEPAAGDYPCHYYGPQRRAGYC